MSWKGVFKVRIFDRAIDVFGNASLSLYLAMALLSLKLWQLSDLANHWWLFSGAQTLTMALYAAFVTFRVMGKNYDAAVLSAGHCGFGMGATPLPWPICRLLPICMVLRIKLS